MTQNPILLGVDVGTTSCKVAAAEANRILHIGAAPYPVRSPRPGWAEQDAETVWEGVARAIRDTCEQIDTARVRAISLSGAMHSLLPMDAKGDPLTPALIWADRRSADHAQRLRTQTDAAALYRRTGCPVQPMYPLAKLIWLREAQPDVFGAAGTFAGIKEYVVYRLTGQVVMEHAAASATGCMDIARPAWDDAALGLAGVSRARLPDLAPCEAQVPILPDAARALGLPEDVHIVLGGTDGALANLGAGAITPGCAALTIGSSGAIRLVGPAPLAHPEEKTWCYLFPGEQYLTGGAINNGGLVLKWFHDAFGEHDGEQDQAAALPPGAEGLLFLPFLAGERCPNWNADARGVLFGLSLRHGRAHMVRAIMEGVAFRMYSIYQALAELDDIAAIHASGGFIQSPLWLQIVADVFGRPITLPDTQEMSAMGAVFLGMWAMGLADTLEEVVQTVHLQPGAEPDMQRHSVYRALYEQFESIYTHITPDFATLADFRQ